MQIQQQPHRIKIKGKSMEHTTKNNNNNNSPNNNAMLQVLQSGTQTESQLSALHLILQYGNPSEKKKSMKEVNRVTYRNEEAARLESSGKPVYWQ
jgi:hypothetical protein